MPKGSLLLHPVDPFFAPEPEKLEVALTTIGFLGRPINSHGWFTGDSFLQLLTFMGCSPHIKLEPESEHDRDFCHITFQASDKPQLLFSANSRPCRCRKCGKPIVTSWNEFHSDASNWHCKHCDHRHDALTEIRWRNDAGMASFMLEIHGIYPGEAQPVDALLSLLNKTAGKEWRYFYLHAL